MDIKTQVYEQSPFYIFTGHLLLSTIIVYLLVSIIEWLRIFLLEKPVFKIKIFNKYFDRFDKWYNISDMEEI